MHLIGSTTMLLALGASAVAGHLIHSTHHHQPAVSYSVIDLHDDAAHASPYSHTSDIHESHPLSETHKIHYAHDHHQHLHGHDHVLAYDQHKDHDEHDEHHEEKDDKHDTHAKYDFKYGVNDPKSGDVKEQWESRDGDKVTGGYSLKESDGTTRIVHYKADKKKGFEAVVHKIGKAKEEHKQPEHHDHVGHNHHVVEWAH